jgi:hypothetical protein
MWVAVTRRRIATPPNIFMPPRIRSFDPFSRVKIGRGVTSTKFSWAESGFEGIALESLIRRRLALRRLEVPTRRQRRPFWRPATNHLSSRGAQTPRDLTPEVGIILVPRRAICSCEVLRRLRGSG